MARLGVMGWPVAHSRSPQMHNAAFQALGMEGWRYQRLPVPPELFAETARALAGAGFAGANVTIPHKEAALALADSAGEPAREIGAANTLIVGPGGSIAAENTDAPGLINALPVDARGLSALVLGAGGSARAAVWALAGAGAAEVSIWNRTAERATALAGEFGARAVPVPCAADILVNCTSVGLKVPASGSTEEERGKRADEGLERSARELSALNQLGLSPDQIGRYPYVVDLVYNGATTALLAAAQRRGAATVDGLEILLAQGALSFELWTGRPAPLAAMRAALRDPR